MSEPTRIKELLKEVIRYAETMRRAQKSIPALNTDTKILVEAKRYARACEAEFDNVLFNAKQLMK